MTTETKSIIAELDPELCKKLMAAARYHGLNSFDAEQLLRYHMMSPQKKASHMEKLYSYIACSDSFIVKRSMLEEIAKSYILPVTLIMHDYDRWLKKGGRPAIA